MKQNKRLLVIMALLAALATLVGTLSAPLYKVAGFPSADALGLLGIFCLSVPAVRLNEQARQIYRVQRLIDRAGSEGDDEEERIKRLASIEAELSKYKGGWSPFVQCILYAGYVLLFASAVARMT